MEKLRDHAYFAHLPIIVVTPKYGGDFDDLLEKGFTDFLSKPFTLVQLENY